jgi:hypothetical protein
MKTYLDTPIELFGIKVGHTYDGLKELITHYTHVLQIAVAQNKISETDRQHCEKMIKNFRVHIQLYEKHMSQINILSVRLQTAIDKRNFFNITNQHIALHALLSKEDYAKVKQVLWDEYQFELTPIDSLKDVAYILQNKIQVP